MYCEIMVEHTPPEYSTALNQLHVLGYLETTTIIDIISQVMEE